jgi:hypothetical protein
MLMLWKPLRFKFGQYECHQYHGKQNEPANHGVELLASCGYSDDTLADL